MRKIKMSQLIGRQLSRLQLGQSYYILIMSTMSALSLISIAFPTINILILIITFPLILLGAFIVGYLLDKTNVTTMDKIKTIEMSARYLNTVDYKNNDFRILQMKSLFRWMKAIQENKPLDFDETEKDLKDFNKKWTPPEKNKKEDK